jgi:hypothetical protein
LLAFRSTAVEKNLKQKLFRFDSNDAVLVAAQLVKLFSRFQVKLFGVIERVRFRLARWFIFQTKNPIWGIF